MKPCGDHPHLRYLFAKGDYFKYRAAMKTLANSVKFDASDPAKFRLKVLEHMEKFGLRSAMNAFDVKKSTVYDWRNAYLKHHKTLLSLVPLSTCPKHTRKMTTDYRLVEFIKVFREDYGNVGKDVVKPFLDTYAVELGINSISETTIGKIIKRRHFTENSIKLKRKPDKKRLRVKRSPKVTSPGLVEIDTVIVMVNDKQYYFVSVIDVFTKFALVRRGESKSAKQALLALQAFQVVNPTPIHTIQTDNGTEFLGKFDEYLMTENIAHHFIYPRCPRINGFVERFNRTIQEQFINRCDELYFDLPKFDEKLTKYLTWYNCKRPHSSLHQLSPMQFITNQIPKCG